MINAEKVRKAMAGGLVFTCAMCDRYWEGDDKGMQREFGNTQCTSKKGCGSPSSGGCFHDYKGPIINHTSICYICGKPSDYGLRPRLQDGDFSHVNGSLKTIGVCQVHFEVISRLRPHQIDRSKIDREPQKVENIKKPEIIS